MLELCKCSTYAIKWEQDKERRHRGWDKHVRVSIEESKSNTLIEVMRKDQMKATRPWGVPQEPDHVHRRPGSRTEKEDRKNYPSPLLFIWIDKR